MMLRSKTEGIFSLKVHFDMTLTKHMLLYITNNFISILTIKNIAWIHKNTRDLTIIINKAIS